MQRCARGFRVACHDAAGCEESQQEFRWRGGGAECEFLAGGRGNSCDDRPKWRGQIHQLQHGGRAATP